MPCPSHHVTLFTITMTDYQVSVAEPSEHDIAFPEISFASHHQQQVEMDNTATHVLKSTVYRRKCWVISAFVWLWTHMHRQETVFKHILKTNKKKTSLWFDLTLSLYIMNLKCHDDVFWYSNFAVKTPAPTNQSKGGKCRRHCHVKNLKSDWLRKLSIVVDCSHVATHTVWNLIGENKQINK